MPLDLAHRGQHAIVEGRLAQLLARKVDLDFDDLDHVPPQDGRCASLIGFMACPTLMLVLVRSTRFAASLTGETECSLSSPR